MVTEQQWQFPEDVIINRALIEALIQHLTERGAIDVDKVLELYRERLNAYKKETEKVPA